MYDIQIDSDADGGITGTGAVRDEDDASSSRPIEIDGTAEGDRVEMVMTYTDGSCGFIGCETVFEGTASEDGETITGEAGFGENEPYPLNA